MSSTMSPRGPLTPRVPALVANLIDASHNRALWDTLLAAVAIHLLAVLAYALGKRQDLLMPMSPAARFSRRRRGRR